MKNTCYTHGVVRLAVSLICVLVNDIVVHVIAELKGLR